MGAALPLPVLDAPVVVEASETNVCDVGEGVSGEVVMTELACVAVTTTVAATELAESWLYWPCVKLQAAETDRRSAVC